VSVWRADPERAADALILGALDALELAVGARLLLVNQHGTLPDGLARAGFQVTVWNRRWSVGSAAAAVPPIGMFDCVLLRLPKSKDELQMLAQQAFASVAVGGRLILYGGNDEGIKTAGPRIESLGGVPVTLSTRGHGRVLALVRGAAVVERTAIAAWRQEKTLAMPGADPRRWIAYPGVFADGALDAGSALMIQHLPPHAAGAGVLDYGCGTGPIARAVLDRDASAKVTMLDTDCMALMAARENVPEAVTEIGGSLGAIGRAQFDAIISNPPLHSGIREDHSIVDRLIMDAPKSLRRGGHLALVVQRRIPLELRLSAQFSNVEIRADDGRYRVWWAR
jgi:16S rRNA (guanine1207-N2)-methyltransferase